MTILRTTLSLAALLLTSTAALAQSVTSPDGRIEASLTVDGEGKPNWSVMRDGEVLIAPSGLGFNIENEDPLRRNFAVVAQGTDSADARWEQPWGERQFVVDRHNELAVTFRQQDAMAREFTVRLRVFDDGVGFRYELPDRGEMRIAEELTEFNLAPAGEAWWIPAGDWNRYEQLYQNSAISAVGLAHTPITFRLYDGTHLAMHEAALVDYSGMWLQRMDGQRFRSVLAPSSRGAKVVRTGAFTTPWRTLRIADDAAGLVENDLELNLNEPNVLGDVSWFEPAKYIGIWWGMISNRWTWAQGERHGATTARTRQYIDFAADNGFHGVLVEGWDYGWDGTWFGNGRDFSFTRPYPDFDLEGLAAYAQERGVHLIGHHETGGNIANYEAQLEDAMALYGRLGIDVVKTGYVADAGSIISCNADIAAPCEGQVMEWHDGQRQVQHHLRVVQEAAENRVAVNPHEPVKDTGLRRTYPNWVTREGARGQEYNAWSVFGNGPDHEPTLVYTRMLSGPMDYTPGVLGLVGDNGMPMASTLAKQLGLYLAIYSPIQMAADFVESLEAHPRELEFIRAVPADWAESHLVAGAIGDYAIFARKDRNSQDWYAGGINDATARDVTLDFAFLEPGTTYRASVWKDGEGATYLTEARHNIAYDSFEVRAGEAHTFHLAPGGGLAIRLQPVR
ncbi:glycoside hydrolase family 97 protein [Erythrobacter arachoides]|uniref:Glycoside hydrolase family 97 protein n=1 Tax=Aurantiacibacter arachoides TaxID=1850444 RepID=A0A845A931_9SPHN|nr:glycoside hydrolase family 97 protein [Aurantiacibacter arachoides]MXO94079.1 glycoside hydrolase family 97 protein [Aurantiacibacter arachoides]GGD66218.1 alpha-glucosidase [Aurantiacibacter arachoides]